MTYPSRKIRYTTKWMCRFRVKIKCNLSVTFGCICPIEVVTIGRDIPNPICDKAVMVSRMHVFIQFEMGEAGCGTVIIVND